MIGLINTSISPEPMAYIMIGTTKPIKWLPNSLGRTPKRTSPDAAKIWAKTVAVL